MNSRGLKTIIYIIIGFLVVGFIFKILPYVLIGGLAFYAVYKCYDFVKTKLGKKKQDKVDGHTYTSTAEQVESSEDDISQAIDVEYKDL